MASSINSRAPSPAHSRHSSVEDKRRAPSPNLSPPDRRSSANLHKSNLEPVLESGARYHAKGGRSTPSDLRPRPQSRPNLSKQRVASTDGTRSRDLRETTDSFVFAEVKTNVMVTNEYTFMTELSQHLAIRYNRPVGSIVVTLQHGMCLLFGGTFDPGYTLTISALPSQLKPEMNRRNTAVLQGHLRQALRVAQGRGFVRFLPVTHDCMGSGGDTVAERLSVDGVVELRKARSVSMRRPTSSPPTPTNIKHETVQGLSSPSMEEDTRTLMARSGKVGRKPDKKKDTKGLVDRVFNRQLNLRLFTGRY